MIDWPRRVAELVAYNTRQAMKKGIEPKRAELIGLPSLGNVQGRFEQDAKRQYVISHHITGQAVECVIPERLQREAADALRQRVMLWGTVYRNHTGEQTYMEVDKIAVIPEDREPPTLDQLAGSVPGITGGRSVEEYVRMLRSEGYDDYPEP